MSYNVADRVLEISNTSGIGAYVLQGAHTGYQSFVAGIGDGVSTLYAATNDVDWEVGLGTVTAGSPDTLSRDTIISSSNGGNAVNWGSDDKVVYCAPPSEYMRHIYWDVNTDRVGIRTNEPQAELDVNGDITLSGEAAYRSAAQLGDFHQSLATKEYVYSLDKSDVLSGHLTWLDSDGQGDRWWDVDASREYDSGPHCGRYRRLGG